MELWKSLAWVGGMNFMRYFFFAGLAYLLFYVVFRRKWWMKKIQSAFPGSRQIRREILHSVLSILIFMGVFAGVTFLKRAGFTQVYTRFADHSLWYFLFSVCVLIVWHDTYFYWTHRLLHIRPFSRFHRLHHRSHNTTPWTSFAFHPVEAVIQGGFVPPILFLMPFHPLAIGIVITWQMAFNVMGHLGYEIFPVWLHKTWLGRWFNTSTHHNMHHRFANANYGLYFTVWDKLLNTNHARYEETYRQESEKMFGKNIPYNREKPLDFPDSLPA